MTIEERQILEKWIVEHPEEALSITRCDECKRPFVEGETAFYVCEDPAGFRDSDSNDYLVCAECYNKYYDWNHLRTRVVID